METLLLQKEIDWSVLHQGMSIPQIYQSLFLQKINCHLEHGQSCMIKIMLDGQLYDAQLKNQGFSRDKFAGHGDVLQIRYSENSPIARMMRAKFSKTYGKVLEYRDNPDNKGKHMRIPDDEKELVVLYATPVTGTIMMDCITDSEFSEEAAALKTLNELEFENATDENATIVLETGVRKIRRLSKAIGNSLKIFYGYRCQICGQFIGEKYGSTIIHAHHIDYFTKSLNNDADNIMVVCPNHHGVIHDRNPIFDRNKKVYTYPNGYSEGLVINKHL